MNFYKSSKPIRDKNNHYLVTIKILLAFILLCIIVPSYLVALEDMNKDYQFMENEIYDLKKFSGPMGTGLSKSYKLGQEKICVYNLVKGQETITLDNNFLKCPLIYRSQEK